MNINSLIAHVIDKTVDRLTRHTLEDDSFAKKVARCSLSDVRSHVVECFNYDELEREIRYDDLAEEIDLDAVVEAIDLDYDEIIGRVDYDVLSVEIAKNHPVQVVSDPCVEGLSNKLLDAAVNKLLTIANSHIEDDLRVVQLD